MRKINKIIVHHTASNPTATKLEDIDTWHKARGFSLVSNTYAGYHYIIEDGPPTVRLGRGVDRTGAHCRGYNTKSIGCAITGSFENGGIPSPEQYRIAVQLVADLCRQFPDADVKGHNELGSTHCPGIDMDKFRKDVLQVLRCHR